MSDQTLVLYAGFTLLASLPVAFTIVSVVSAAHNRDLTMWQFCTCWICLLAYKLDRYHGRHRLEDNYEAQRHIRADFHELTPYS